ncbi:hypothetical protein M513_06855 [Trichuris suis]|uniref:Hint module n=1 Tax=Trichuris suis TaxID=68888 RepID=A0A085M4Z6_9BILA|nr:hypothetical protein M513_06855 [Trichuris suis]
MPSNDPAVSALIFGLTILYPINAGYVDPAEFGTFYCQPNEVLSIYAKGPGYVKLSCTKPVACGYVTECKPISSEPACPQVNHFARGILRLASGRISAVYCRINDPDETMTTETCESYNVRPNDFDPNVDVLSEAEALKTGSEQNDDVSRSSTPVLKLFRLMTSSRGTEMVKVVRRTQSGYMVTACKVGCLQEKGSTDLSEVNIKDGNYLCDDCRVPPTTSSPFGKDNSNPNVGINAYQKSTAAPSSLGDPGYRIMPGFVYPTSYIGSGVKKLPFTSSSSRLLNLPIKTSSSSGGRGHTTKRDCGQCFDGMNQPVSPQSQFGPTSRLAGGGCFSSDMQVNLGNMYKRMDQLNLGDHVLVDAYKTQTVDTMIHRNPSVQTDFVVLTTRSNRTLALTPEHLIPLMDCNDKTISLDSLERLASRWSQFASKATTEHCVIVLDVQAGILLDRITTVSRARKRGVFSPVTSQGTLVVNDVFVSCFSLLENHDFQLLFHKATKSIRQLLTGLTSLFRFEHCSYTRISWDSLYIESLLRLAQWASSMGIV